MVIYTEREKIAAMHASKLNVRTIATRLHLSQSYVRSVVESLPKENALAWNNCLRCKHAWPKRDNIPEKCPKCRSILWRRPRQRAAYKLKNAQEAVQRAVKPQQPDPTPADIARETAEIRAKWSQPEHLRRAGIIHQEVEIRVISCSDAAVTPPGAEDGGAGDREKFWT